MVVGLALRLLTADNDLWLDEIWTLWLLGQIQSVGDIFWGISHDNNHFLNSLHLYLVGETASPLLQRAASVAAGVGTIAAAGAFGWRRSPLHGLTAMTVFALSYPMVHFGSEARGYAALVLFTVLAVHFLEGHLEGRGRWQRWLFGGSVGLGLLAHLNMASAAAVLLPWTLWVTGRRDRSLGGILRGGWSVLLPTLVGALPAVAVVAAGWLVRGGITLGGYDPFVAELFLHAYGLLLALEVGLPAQLSPAALAGSAVTVVAAAIWWRDGGWRRSLYVCGVLCLPLCAFVVQLPSTHFSRYFLVFGTFLLLFVADMLAEVMRGRRGAGIALLGLFLIGQGVSLHTLIRHGRGHYTELLRRVTADGPAVVSGSDVMQELVVTYYAERLGLPAVFVPNRQACRLQPEWYIASSPRYWERQAGFHPVAPRLVVERQNCRLTFQLVEVFASSPLAGWQMALYRRR